MKVRSLIKRLLDYNPDAEVFTVVDNRKLEFAIAFTTAEKHKEDKSPIGRRASSKEVLIYPIDANDVNKSIT